MTRVPLHALSALICLSVVHTSAASAAVAASAAEGNSVQCSANGNADEVIENINKGELLFMRVAGVRPGGVASVQPQLYGVRLNNGREQTGQAGLSPEYARLVVTFHPCTEAIADDRDYKVESRGWFSRWILQRISQKILSVTATVNPLGVKGVKPLITVNRDSGAAGDNWVTDVEDNAILIQYFRASPNQTANIDIAFNSDRQNKFSGASKALEIAKTAAGLIAPTGHLVTTLNKDRFNQSADFVDNTISGLLNVSIQEQAHLAPKLNDGCLENSRDGKCVLATLTLYAPGANNVFGPIVPIGQWRIEQEYLAGTSIFDLRLRGGAAAAEPVKLSDYSAASIMNFHVADNTTLKQALAADNDVAQARDALLSSQDTSIGDAALKFCRSAALRIDALGFGRSDTGRAVWAYLTDVALPDAKQHEAFDRCAQLEDWPTSELVDLDRGDTPTQSSVQTGKLTRSSDKATRPRKTSVRRLASRD